MCPSPVKLGLMQYFITAARNIPKADFFHSLHPPLPASPVLHVTTGLALPVDQGTDPPLCMCMVGQIVKHSYQVNF